MQSTLIRAEAAFICLAAGPPLSHRPHTPSDTFNSASSRIGEDRTDEDGVAATAAAAITTAAAAIEDGDERPASSQTARSKAAELRGSRTA